MPRYIDADALTRRFKRRGCFNKEAFGVMAATIIATAPTADVVEVVRCKDCTEFRVSKGCAPSYCERAGCEVDGDDFCSYGERRNDEQETDS